MNPTAILVACGDDALADALSRMLAAMGYVVLERAATGAKALEILEQKRASLVLVDAALEGEVDAFALSTAVRSRVHAPVILLRAPSDNVAVTRLRAARPSGYVNKPPTEGELRNAIEIALHKSELEAALKVDTKHEASARARVKDQRLAQAERLASLAKVAGAMAHEVNNPLTYVVANLGYSLESLDDLRTAFARVAAADPKITPEIDRALGVLREVTEALGEAQKGAGRARRIMQDLARFVRAEDPSTSLVDLPDVIEEAIAMANASTNITLHSHATFGTTPFVEGNVSRLVQLFTNIFVNAAEAIRARPAGTALAEGIVEITTSTDEGGRACVEIADNGTGMSNDVLTRAFDPFFTTRENASALGLGLTVSREIAARLGGEITAKSSPHGAVFHVALPPASRLHGKSESIKAGPSAPRRGRVLVVDDESAIAKLVERILRSAHDVVVENDARAALGRIAGGEQFDVIFCDLMMPHLTGMDLHDTLVASNPELAKRVVFMTGGAFSERSREFLDKVEIVSIAKPFSAETLRSIARDYTR